MREIILTISEELKYETIRDVINGNTTKRRASVELGCTIRTIDRMVRKYEELGKDGFSHKNKDNKYAVKISSDTRKKIVKLYQSDKYSGADLSHFAEMIDEYENIKVSRNTIANILLEEKIVSPYIHKRTKKRLRKQWSDELNAPKVKINTRRETSKALRTLEESHPTRSRSKYSGEQLQMDASDHLWFGNVKASLHIAIDDCIRNIVGAYFDWQETLDGYYHIFYQILTDYGIPAKFITDKRTVFTYSRTGQILDDENDANTQFQGACKRLGVDIFSTTVAQAKGRVERGFGTHQKRLIAELKARGIVTIEEANAFLPEYVDRHNKKYGTDIDIMQSVFVPVDTETINLSLAILKVRQISNGNCIQFEHKVYKPIDKDGKDVHIAPKKRGMVAVAFDKQKFFLFEDEVYALVEVPEIVETSKEFDRAVVKKIRKPYIPPPDHPWRSDNPFSRRKR